MIFKLYPYKRLVKMNQLMVIKQTPKLFPRIYRFHVWLEHCMSDTRLSVLQADQIHGNVQFSKPLSCAKATASSQELLFEMRHTGANKFIYKLRYFTLKINYTYLFIYLFLGADLEDVSQESFLSFFHVFNQVQFLMLSSKHLYPFGHLTGPKVFFNKNFLDYLSVTQLNHM